MSNEGYSRLEPFSIEQRVRLSTLALNFFSPRNYSEMCAHLNKETTEGRVEPFNGLQFLRYLDKTKHLPEANRYLHRVGELLSQLADARLLTDVGHAGNPMLGTCYYFIRVYSA